MRYLHLIWESWKKIAHKIGTFQSRVILTIFYFVILFPAGIVYSTFKDVLGIKKVRSSEWINKQSKNQTLEELRKQY
jgi:hypothetical protein